MVLCSILLWVVIIIFFLCKRDHKQFVGFLGFLGIKIASHIHCLDIYESFVSFADEIETITIMQARA